MIRVDIVLRYLILQRYDIGHVAGYVQACMDHGLKVTWIEGEE